MEAKNNNRPFFWKTRLNEIQDVLKNVVYGSVRVLTQSAGARDILMVEYGEKEELNRRANYSSACGAKDPEYFAKKDKDTKPVILIVGATHGGELEGIVGILNLINIIETGVDFTGKGWSYIHENRNKFRILLIPCLNVDGRARLPLDSLHGVEYNTARHYILGSWKDGSLCSWPDCKAVHPIKDHVDFLGSYFNDDGINFMHDNFFNPMAREVQELLNMVEAEVPDYTILLHGGGNSVFHFSPTAYIPLYLKKRIWSLGKAVKDRYRSEKLEFMFSTENDIDGKEYPPPSFNLTSAIHHVCGGVSILYESNMGYDDEGKRYTYNEILDAHLLLFEEVLKAASESDNR